MVTSNNCGNIEESGDKTCYIIYILAYFITTIIVNVNCTNIYSYITSNKILNENLIADIFLLYCCVSST